MEKQLNSVEYAQVEYIIEKLAKENGIDSVHSVHVAMTDDQCTIKFAVDDQAPEKGTFESIGSTAGGALGAAAGTAAAGALLLDDATGIGVADDFLIPVLPKAGGELGAEGGEFLGKKLDDFLGSDEESPESDTTADKAAAEATDFTKFADIQDFNKYALNAYDIGQGLNNAGNAINDVYNPMSQAWKDNVWSPIGNTISDFSSGLTGGQQTNNFTQVDPNAAPVQGTSIHDQAMANKQPAAAPTSPQQVAQPGAQQQTQTYNSQLSPESIASIQEQLGVTADGIIGPDTEAAIKQFQTANGLSPDGIVGPQTTDALAKAQTGQQTDWAAGLPDWAAQGYNTQEEYQAAQQPSAAEPGQALPPSGAGQENVAQQDAADAKYISNRNQGFEQAKQKAVQ